MKTTDLVCILVIAITKNNALGNIGIDCSFPRFSTSSLLMVHVVNTYTTLGLEGFAISVEVDSARALPTIEIIGLPDAAIKESKERIRATFRNCELDFPPRKIILNLAPSDIKKIGTSFDVPMAVAILVMTANITPKAEKGLEQVLFFGELGLDGSIKRVNGLLPAVISAMKDGYRHFVVPQDNQYELEYLPDITIYPVDHFQHIVDHLTGQKKLQSPAEAKNVEDLYQQTGFEVDFADIKGHIALKRALSIAAAGSHNVLLVGAPGTGKTMLSKALQGILPPLGFEEIVDVSQIYSVVGKLDKDTPLITQRPFRQVHHTASKVAIVGGGARMTPGEVSLAHRGILFFDELPEFPREVLEVLRQPIEDKNVTISRANGSVQYPANFMFVAAMNPCKCGFYKDPDKNCSCSFNDIKRYQSKISGPLLDRIDMILEVPREKIDTIIDSKEKTTSDTIRQRVISARQAQQKRFAKTDLTANAHMQSKHIDEMIQLDDASKNFLKKASDSLHLSARVIHRTIKLARTIADYEGSEDLTMQHLAEALQYRSKTMFVEE